MAPESERDTVFADQPSRKADFEFDEKVASVFDDMLVRSVPFYREQQQMVRDICGRFWIEGTGICDLGCSTGTTLLDLASSMKQVTSFIGYDNSGPMIQRARDRLASAGLAERVSIRHGDLNSDPSLFELEGTSVVTMCWTLQFVRPLSRDSLIRRIYEALVEDGVLLVTEKILTDNSMINRFFIDFYYDFKRKSGYSDEEILRKREALENVLVPYRLQENFELFRRNGFEMVDTFFQWYNFAGFLCIKKPACRA